MTRYKIGIIEDDALLAEALKVHLESDERVYSVFSTHALASGLGLIESEPLDFLIVDIGLPDGDGVSAIYQARSCQPACKIIVYSVFEDDARLFKALQAGAHGYIQKQDTHHDLLTTLLNVQEGATVSPAIAKRMLAFFSSMSDPFAPVDAAKGLLSARETQVLKHVSQGKSLSEISVMMELSHHTVKTYLRRVYEKLEVNSKLQAIEKAKNNFWI
ncbi:response regulator transcription factor [Methylophilus methylotrophus]|uniref:response regulator transcription factor n=1 Tax=Methylophilus methylotrophus TaxID=17 RepID=UPI00035CF730|nr:response regulator transcription factor [Methylophilus methylotrophus]